MAGLTRGDVGTFRVPSRLRGVGAFVARGHTFRRCQAVRLLPPRAPGVAHGVPVVASLCCPYTRPGCH